MTRSSKTTGGDVWSNISWVTGFGKFSVNSTRPSSPNERMSDPSAAFSAYRLSRLLMKIRMASPAPAVRLPLAGHTATPRCLKPPGGPPSGPVRHASGSNAQSCSPVSASSATTRVYMVETYTTLSIISGMTSKLPGRVRNSWFGSSFGSHVQATSSRSTFEASMSASGEYFEAAWSAPT